MGWCWKIIFSRWSAGLGKIRAVPADVAYEGDEDRPAQLAKATWHLPWASCGLPLRHETPRRARCAPVRAFADRDVNPAKHRYRGILEHFWDLVRQHPASRAYATALDWVYCSDGSSEFSQFIVPT